MTNAVERHQWLEISSRPSMRGYLVDLWYEDAMSNTQLVGMPIEEAYTNLMYPRGLMAIKNKAAKVEEYEY